MADQHDPEQIRQSHLDLILESDERFKLIVAGPGTGKTYAFKQLLHKNPGENLVLTFINNLVYDMERELQGLAEVRTFHSYCRKLLHRIPSAGINSSFHFFPKLAQVIAQDASIVAPELLSGHQSAEECFREALQTLVENDGRVDFFMGRADFYNAVGFDDAVYRVLTRFRLSPDDIPAVKQLIVDEYQDFNTLEVEFISCLETKSPTLIVGDDDQAIYDFRYATPQHLREKARDAKFRLFSLPYCSRCPQVIISAAHCLIKNARSNGLLKDRLEKQLLCYLPDKQADSENFPTIIHAECSVHSKKAPYISKYIAQAILSIPQGEVDESLERKYPLVLVVGPSHYLTQIYEYLKSLFPNVTYAPRPDMSLNLLDGYLCLLRNEDSNLGWRVILGLDDPESLPGLLFESTNKRRSLTEVIEPRFREEHQQRLAQMRRLLEGAEGLESETATELGQYFGRHPTQILEYMGRAESQEAAIADADLEGHGASTESSPVIKLTTYSGCKGLSAGFTFVTGLEDGVFPRRNAQPSDREVCQFIVAITRTRKQCQLINTRNFAGHWCTPSVFLGWVLEDGCTNVKVSKSHFASP